MPAPAAGFEAGARFVPFGRFFFADDAALLPAWADGGFVDRPVVRFVAAADGEPCFAAEDSAADGAPVTAVTAAAVAAAAAAVAGAATGVAAWAPSGGGKASAGGASPGSVRCDATAA